MLIIAGGAVPARPKRQTVFGRRPPENKNVQPAARIQKCITYETYLRKTRDARERRNNGVPPPPPGDPRRVPARRTNAGGWPPGAFVTVVRALQEIRYYQKHSNSLVLGLAPFRRIVREIADQVPRESNVADRFTEECMLLLQMAAEEHITNFMEMS